MNTPKSENPFFLVLLTVLFLSLLAFVQQHYTLPGLDLKPVNLLADVVVTDAPLPFTLPVTQSVIPRSATKATDTTQLATTAAADSTVSVSLALDTLRIENLGSLYAFYQALYDTKATGKKTRIAYFGDSMIEGDLITGELRNKLQYEFGGEGVGFVPITSITADFRNTILHSFSPNWKSYNLVSKKIPTDNPLGISGHVFLPNVLKPNLPDSVEKPVPSWVQYAASKMYKKLSSFRKIRLFYGPGSEKDKLVVVADKKQVIQPLSGSNRVNELLLPTEGPAKKLKLEFDCFDRRNVYGLSFESDSGVIVDNFSFRGNSGMSLSKINKSVLQDFEQYQHYNLIILHYGINVANYKVKDYRFYERGMTRVVNQLKQAFPEASILLIGMSDKSYNNAGQYITDPSIPLLLQAQYNIAQKNDVAFWNLFEAMGGYNSMVSWVEAKPPLANKDYTHINYNGSRKVAALLYQHLMQGYQFYQNQQAKL
ncbi:MAG: hypothetical protein LPJ89_08525 [Hymenobacteraceae bacterium]|nr:hypothetical protein [Hymenobacteraceae bacterium]